jgi:hypothetical protein
VAGRRFLVSEPSFHGGEALCRWAAPALFQPSRFFSASKASRYMMVHDGEIFHFSLVVVWCCVMTFDGRLL